jgi:hypothetical protein
MYIPIAPDFRNLFALWDKLCDVVKSGLPAQSPNLGGNPLSWRPCNVPNLGDEPKKIQLIPNKWLGCDLVTVVPQ